MKRILSFPLVRLALIVAVWAVSLVIVLFTVHKPSPHDSIGWTIALNWLTAVLLLASYIGLERFVAGQSFTAIGFNPRRAVPDLTIGVTLGAILFSAVVLELVIAGSYTVQLIYFRADLALAAVLLIGAALTEELLFRGLVFRLVQESAGTWIALGVSAVIFGAMHAASPGASLLSTLAIALEAGVLLAAAYIVTKNLWLPIGLHFAWNFFEGPIYGTQVSGHSFVVGAIHARVSGPAWLTGGAFGPEAGLPAVLTCLVAAIILLAYAKRSNLIRPPSWAAHSRLVETPHDERHA